MGNTQTQTKPPVVLVPPLFDFPPLAARTRMLDSSYDVLFGKLALKCLFQDYFEKASSFNSRIMLKSIEDPHVDVTVTAEASQVPKSDGELEVNALLRWQGDVDNPNTFVDLRVSNTDPILQVRSCAFHPGYGLGAFGIFPLLLKNGRVSNSDYGRVGLRHSSENLSFGASVMPYSCLHSLEAPGDLIKTAWLVSKLGRLTAGVQYEPKYGSKEGGPRYRNPSNWSYAVGYGVGSKSPFIPSFNFSLELANSSQFIASFYQHVVLQRRVFDNFGAREVVGITNYIDLGFELQTRIGDANKENNIRDSTFQLAASWQANKNLMLKGKVGPRSETAALTFKSWWKPSFAFNVSATRDRKRGDIDFGFGIRVDNVKEASYQRADPNFVMLTPSMEHLAEGVAWEVGYRPVLPPSSEAGNLEAVPTELKPNRKML